nr:hypothetical protein GCM10020092_078970 [Actinoplanes digitatis]
MIKSVWVFHEYGGNLAWSSRLDEGKGWIGTDGTISSSATDKVGIDHTELWVDGVFHSSATGQSAFFYWHDATRGRTFANLEVRVTNRVGLTTTKAFRLNIDNVGPVLQISPRAEHAAARQAGHRDQNRDRSAPHRRARLGRFQFSVAALPVVVHRVRGPARRRPNRAGLRRP